MQRLIVKSLYKNAAIHKKTEGSIAEHRYIFTSFFLTILLNSQSAPIVNNITETAKTIPPKCNIYITKGIPTAAVKNLLISKKTPT